MPAGRPKIEIDKTEFEKLCALQCTVEEIAGFFDCSVATVERWCERTYGQNFADVFFIKRQKGKISLRRSQFQLAEKNATMAIFLGKNYLGQTDETSTGTGEVRLAYIVEQDKPEEPPEDIEEEADE